MDRPSLLVRALRSCRERGPHYAIHKALRRTPGRYAQLKRSLLYRNQRAYWTLRGGPDYFLEQEDQPAREVRARWIATRIASYHPRSILEIGCGYGKQIRAIRNHLDCPITGIDWSSTQVAEASRYLAGLPEITLLEADARALPFGDDSFDLVLTSAVILHNPPREAEAIRREVLRVGHRFAVHNEDTDQSYNRYGYDTSAWYRKRGIELMECGAIETVPEPERARSQFCVARLS
jgi:SAM-dependent methyltransferase